MSFFGQHVDEMALFLFNDTIAEFLKANNITYIKLYTIFNIFTLPQVYLKVMCSQHHQSINEDEEETAPVLSRS